MSLNTHHAVYINNYKNIESVSDNMNNFINSSTENKKGETYYYLGEHHDGYDMYGPIIVYHYISETMRNGRNLNMINPNVYDLEIWPVNRLWFLAGPGKNITLEVEDLV